MVVNTTLAPVVLYWNEWLYIQHSHRSYCNGINGCIYNTRTRIHNLWQNNVLFIFVFPWCCMQTSFIVHCTITWN